MSTLQAVGNLEANAGPTTLAALLVTRCLAIIVVGLRFFARRIGGSPYWWDDWFVLGAAVSSFLIMRASRRKI